MHFNARRLFSGLFALLLLAGSAKAGLLAVDPNALPGWQGTQTFTGTTGPNTLVANVDYAVYAPGAFGASAALGFPGAADPSGGTQFVYAYEIFNTGGNSNALNLSVALIPGAIPFGSTNIGDDPLTPAGGVAPNIDQFIPLTNPKSNAKWSYTTNILSPGLHSDILLFTSPFGPQTLISSMQGGHTTIASAGLPSPVPEPATVVLSAIALVGLWAARRFRGQTRVG